MSLINDALRRANERKKVDSGSEQDVPMRPVSTERDVSFFKPVLILTILVVVIGVILTIFLTSRRVPMQAVSSVLSPPSSSAPRVELKQERPVVAPAAQALAPVTTNPLPSVTNLPVQARANSVSASTNLESPTPVPAPVVVLKLQGIFYRGPKSTVLINGKTLAIGDSILEARVAKITQQDVTLERAGKTLVLTLP